jgi:hypothetical protein
MIETQINRIARDITELEISVRRCDVNGNVLKSAMLKERIEVMKETIQDLREVRRAA